MQECFLTHNDIEALARQTCPGDIALNDPNAAFEADQRGQFSGPANAARVEVYPGDIGSKPVRPIPSRSTEPSTEIRDTISGPNFCAISQSVIGRQPTVVVLIVRIEVLGREVLQVPRDARTFAMIC